jgi:hypothetical protein
MLGGGEDDGGWEVETTGCFWQPPATTSIKTNPRLKRNLVMQYHPQNTIYELKTICHRTWRQPRRMKIEGCIQT